MGKDYFKDSGIPPTYNVDHPEMAIWNSFFSAQELNFSSEKDCFTEPNYNCLTSQQSHHFGSSLNSMVSSGVPNDTFLLHKLIGNSGNLSQMVNYDLPNCPNSESLTHVYPPLVADQGFIERAAKFSCFLGNNSLECNEAENTVSGAKPANSNEKSSVSELVKSCRKRKTFSQETSKVDMVEKADEIDNAKRSKAKEENWKVHSGGKKEKETKSGNDTSGEDESGNQEKGKQNTPEPPKDYIHVRARRGQATDSHSLAERVRREKISERMKLLEDLVPGCNKVTGKALMLDEIINYVQALQHQVEFLSMKLASVNTGMSSAGDSLVPKPMFQPNALYSSHPQQAPQQLKNYASTGSVSQFPMNPMDRSTGLGMPLPPSDRFGEGPPQVVNRCEGDLQSIVQRAISHDGQNALHSLGFLSQNQVASMKIEL